MNGKFKKYFINITLIVAVALLVVFFLTRNDLEEIQSLLANISFFKLLALASIPILQFIVTGIILKVIINHFDKDFNLFSAINWKI